MIIDNLLSQSEWKETLAAPRCKKGIVRWINESSLIVLSLDNTMLSMKLYTGKTKAVVIGKLIN